MQALSLKRDVEWHANQVSLGDAEKAYLELADVSDWSQKTLNASERELREKVKSEREAMSAEKHRRNLNANLHSSVRLNVADSECTVGFGMILYSVDGWEVFCIFSLTRWHWALQNGCGGYIARSFGSRRPLNCPEALGLVQPSEGVDFSKRRSVLTSKMCSWAAFGWDIRAGIVPILKDEQMTPLQKIEAHRLHAFAFLRNALIGMQEMLMLPGVNQATAIGSLYHGPYQVVFRA